MKRIALLITCIALANAPAGAQSFLKKLGERAKNAAENNIGNKVEKGVNDILNGNVGKADKEAAGQSGNDAATSVTPVVPGTNQASEAEGKWFCPECGTANTAKFCTECGTKKPDGAPEAKTETVKSDFERGSVVLFEDDFKDEQVGEFPSKWDIQGEGNAETGKFVTNNILFDTGKATLKPESMPEIDKVAEYMKANPTARFEVQGHTDNQGSDKVNDPLSQQRAETVVWYRKRLLAKFDVHTSPALISEVLKRGLL